MKRIGMLTSGGDCQALNAAMRGVVKTLLNNKEKAEIYGFLDGYKGLIYGKYRTLGGDDFSGILTKGGTILGSSRTPFKTIQDPDENGLNKVEAMKQNYKKLKLDCLVILGGNGTHKTANLLRQEGLTPAAYTFPTVKPIDRACIERCAKEYELIVTVEENTVVGGFGSAVAEVLAEMRSKRAYLLRIGLNDTYATKVGNQKYLRKQYGIDSEYIARRTEEAING